MYTKEEIDAANELDIVDVAERLDIEVTRHKDRAYCHCLNHDDAHPSMQLGSAKGGRYAHIAHCYACGKSYNVIGLVMEHEHCDFLPAMDWIKDHFINFALTSPSLNKPNTSARSPSVRLIKGSDPLIRRDGPKHYASLEMLEPFVSDQNALAQCLRTVFPDEVVQQVSRDYRLGTAYDVCHYDHTIFPSIDMQGRVHNVKAQGYCTTPSSPLFFHSIKGQTRWVGPQLFPSPLIKGSEHSVESSKMGSNPPFDALGFDTDCLFGEHLLKEHPDSVVGLVESPKNAIVCACDWPHVVWVAVGNKGMLKRELLEPLRGRRVVVFPDRDAIGDWSEKLHAIKDLAQFTMSGFCQYKGEAENKKMDIADLILKGPNARRR